MGLVVSTPLVVVVSGARYRLRTFAFEGPPTREGKTNRRNTTRRRQLAVRGLGVDGCVGWCWHEPIDRTVEEGCRRHSACGDMWRKATTTTFDDLALRWLSEVTDWPALESRPPEPADEEQNRESSSLTSSNPLPPLFPSCANGRIGTEHAKGSSRDLPHTQPWC